jgi:hypothetical protein
MLHAFSATHVDSIFRKRSVEAVLPRGVRRLL